MASPFEILRIGPDADEDEIEQAYRRRVVETHPDQGGTREEFQLVRDAYEELSSESQAGARAIEREEVDDVERPDETSPEEDTQTGTTVAYLDYEALDDHGWGLEDDDLFEKAAGADLDSSSYGKFLVHPDESLLEAAENRGFAWPFACRGGACANCAVAVVEGEMEMSVDNVLSQELLDRGIRLSCIGQPTTEELKVVYNVKQLPDLDDLKLPADRFERAWATD